MKLNVVMLQYLFWKEVQGDYGRHDHYEHIPV